MHEGDLTRRAFLSRSSAAATAVWLAGQLPAIASAAAYAREARSAGASFSVLTVSEAAVVDAIAGQIIPSDDTPGAREAGVVHFVDRAFETFMSGALEGFRSGLVQFEQGVQARYSTSFSKLDFEKQTEALRTFESTPFFGFLRYLTIVGTFGDPGYGGNRDKVGWKILGYQDRHAWQPPFGYYDEHAEESER